MKIPQVNGHVDVRALENDDKTVLATLSEDLERNPMFLDGNRHNFAVFSNVSG